MSLSVIVDVLHKSSAKGNMRLCLIAIAENANDDGIAWPGLPLIRKKMGGVAEDTARKAVGDAIMAGELEVAWGAGPRRTNVYWVKSGLPDGAPRPEDFEAALARSAWLQAEGKVTPQARFRCADEDAGEACASGGDAGPEAAVDKAVTPPESGGGDEAADPPRNDGVPPSGLGDHPPSGLGGNRKEPSLNPRARPPAMVRGVSVTDPSEADRFDRAASSLIAEKGESWWVAWLAYGRAVPGEPWVIEVKSAFVAKQLAQVAGDRFEQLLGSKVRFVGDARRAPPASGEPEGRHPKAGKRRKGRR